ncbi:pyruvate dehydrogenase complex dihydrolipoamide acetyltransferase [Antarcticibacterium flavum]|uniref:Acetyltransferase component of pyruvate dehydrogenase complex n=1 Tax=Antarcticibacterium flavum TaxID=2058175 RepID=A0A5B7X1N8_9FLAO|nr:MULTISPECIES: pyruvate dehydrogenase complex dihydrolipoamide acetyltransferase [Antarcticibacterium]MCM4160489.1 pyruvate dehydrogenase complex dihydrolipoamide acetyltransferase [Antarcticibacterium sp. W02-3]QCY69229.1 pyruvate dehydrogenase complex dihydrolipoamide acetyltransferase [Antarcticibacterium flavum]
MAEVIKMPRLSDTMEEGVVAKWLKSVGDKVEEGDILAEIETDKATMEFESFYEGTLLHIGIEEGETAPVDNLLAIIGEEGEDISGLISGGGDSTAKEEKKDPSEKSDSSENEEEETESSDSSDETSGEIPEGVEVIKMPRLSDTMEEGTVASWLKKEGDKVEEGDILAEIETDKATMEFESFYEGTLLKIGIQEGETAKVDSLLAIIGPEGTDVSGIGTGDGSKKAKGGDSKKESKKEESKTATEDSSSEKSAQASDGTRIFASPLAKRMAEDKGIDLSQVKGSGENGRIVKKDIESYKPSEKAAPAKEETARAEAPKEEAAAVKPYVPAGEESFEEIKNSQMRKTIAKRLGESKFTAPHYYLTIEVNMEVAMASRKQINELPDVKVSFNDMVIKASAMALRKHPRVNSQWTGDSTKIAKHIHMGVAVAVDEGLVVPVLRYADQMSMTQIGANVKDLAGKARNKKLQPQEMEGSTFTVSNLGMFGITEFTSIINQPNSAILSVGAIVEKPVVKNGQIVVGNTMKVTLACDHRTVDGATGAAFLQTLKSYLENPVTMLA